MGRTSEKRRAAKRQRRASEHVRREAINETSWVNYEFE